MERINQRIREAEEQYRDGKRELKAKMKEDTLALGDKLASDIINSRYV